MLRCSLGSLLLGAVLVALSAVPAYARVATEQTMASEQTMSSSASSRSIQSTRSNRSGQTAMMALAHGVLFDLNRIRAEHGLPPLTLNPELSDAAAQHTSEMVADGYFAHESHDGAAFWKRLTSYTRSAKSSWGVGENLLWSSPDVGADEALKLWMDSPEHRANILSRQWRQIGIAAISADEAPGTYGGNSVTVITTDFGFRT